MAPASFPPNPPLDSNAIAAASAAELCPRILDALPAALVSADASGRIVYANAPAGRLFDVTDPGALIGGDLAALLAARANLATETLALAPSVAASPGAPTTVLAIREHAPPENGERLRQALRADVNAAFGAGGTLAEALSRCTDALVRRLDVAFARVWILDPHDRVLVLRASSGKYTHLDGPHGRVPVGKLEIGGIAAEGKPHITNDVLDDPLIADKEWAAREGMTAFAGHPLHVEGRVLGVLAMFATHALSEPVIAATFEVADLIAQVAERRRAEEALAERARDLERSNSELQHFAYVASHDLREPLRMVASFIQLLTEEYGQRLDATAHEYIAYATDGARRMQRLLDDLLRYSRVQSRGNALGRAEPARALAAALEELKPRLDETGAAITRGEFPRDVRGDEGQLVELFRHLVDNAIKFRRPGTRPRVQVSAERRGGEWVFAVRDDGIGIAPEHFERIFVIFQRLHARSEYEGTGIGLAIAKKIVERHGGRIWVESAPEKGATFYFTLGAV